MKTDFQKNKTISVFVAILMLSAGGMLVTIPAASAHTPPVTVPTWCYIATRNNVIGLGQQDLIPFWINAIPPTAVGQYGDRWQFTILITKPDGSVDTRQVTSDPIGGGFILYNPTAVGTYSAVAKFASKVIDGTPNGLPPGFGPFSNGYSAIGDTYQTSTSAAVTFTVQQAPIQEWQEPPIPLGYWTVPVTTLNRGWAPLIGNWLAAEAQNVGPTTGFAYGTAPDTAHILWTRPMALGGIMDARFGDKGYATYYYDGYSLSPPIILNGVLYYNVEENPREGWYAVNLYTGQTNYFHNTTGPVTGAGGVFDSVGSITGDALNFGQIFDYESPNQVGGFAYLWAAPVSSFFAPLPSPPVWKMFDAFTGNYICSLNNIPSFVGYGSGFFFGADTNVYGKDGSITSYNIQNYGTPAAPNLYLQIWNTTQAIWYNANQLAQILQTNTYWMWRPTLNTTFDGNNGYSMNQSIPAVSGGIMAIRESQYVIGGTAGKNNGTYVQLGNLWAINLNSTVGTVGSLLWNITFTPPQGPPDIALSGPFGGGGITGPTVDPEDGVFMFYAPLTGNWWGYSLASSKQIWGPSPSEPSYNYYGITSTIYNSMLLTCGYAGELIAYNVNTGNVAWTFNATQVGFESPYGNYPLGIGAIADGKIYLGSGEHHEGGRDPPTRGPNLRCVNASNGVELWKLDDFGISMPGGNGGSNYAIGDGYLIALNGFDSQIYCVGKGPTATTVTAPDVAISQGSAVMIKGKVIDQSPGAKGAACVSDNDQEAWMDYLYENQAMPTNATGVPVVLTAFDPNNNTENVGTAYTDSAGNYGYMWTPPVPGTYKIIATFQGSHSYGDSYATTYIGVSPAPAPAVSTPKPVVTPTVVPTAPTGTTPTPTPQTTTPPTSPPSPSVTPPGSSTPLATYIAIAAAVVIILVVAAALALRRRK